MSKEKTYGIPAVSVRKQLKVPELPYRPRDPRKYRPNIGLIGCGGITQSHLRAYRKAGYSVVALCDINREQAEARRKEFYPKAEVYTDYHQVLERSDIEVVDIATHPAIREPIIRDAIRARKHILSQKPFVLNLDSGRKLAAAANREGVHLAVNQNGRWSPHFSYMRQAIAKGHLGELIGAHFSMHWNHDWVAQTPFDSVPHLMLYDFAIHWFDILSCFMRGQTAQRVYASEAASLSQKAKQPLLCQVLVEYENSQASLVFDGCVPSGSLDRTVLTGTKATLMSQGPDLNHQKLTLMTPRGHASPRLHGSWFNDGFHGTMAELLCSIEEEREPDNSAHGNLDGLALCFAAIASVELGRPVKPGTAKTSTGAT